MPDPLISEADLHVEFLYSQLHIYGSDPWASDSGSGETFNDRAVNSALELKIGLGVADGMILLAGRAQWIEDAPLKVQVWASTPPFDVQAWDHVVDVDLDITEGNVYFEAPGVNVFNYPLTDNRYRVRIARKENLREAGDPLESFQLQFWPRIQDSPVTVIKRSPTIAELFT